MNGAGTVHSGDTAWLPMSTALVLLMTVPHIALARSEPEAHAPALVKEAFAEA